MAVARVSIAVLSMLVMAGSTGVAPRVCGDGWLAGGGETRVVALAAACAKVRSSSALRLLSRSMVAVSWKRACFFEMFLASASMRILFSACH